MVPRLMGLCAVIPASILLTLSFFVLIALRKAEEKVLKVLGYIALTFLLSGATLVVLSGVHTLITGKCPMMQQMMQAKQDMMCKGMMRGPMMNKQEMMEKELLMHKMKMKERKQMMGNQGIMEKEE